MVFSGELPISRQNLKVVDIDHLKQKKVSLETKPTGGEPTMNSGGGKGLSSPDGIKPSTSFSEVYLKPEPMFEENTMHRTSDCEFFQDLGVWCSEPAKEEPQQIIDSDTLTKQIHNTDTLHTLLSPSSWELDANSPSVAGSLYTHDLSPTLGSGYTTMFPELNDRKTDFRDQFIDIGSLPVVFGDEILPEIGQDTYIPIDTNTKHNTLHEALIDQDDSLDLKLCGEEVRWSEVMPGLAAEAQPLRLDTAAAAAWPTEPVAVTTPEVLSYVVQLEKEHSAGVNVNEWPTQEDFSFLSTASPACTSSFGDSAPVTPTPTAATSVESDEEPRARRRRRRSDDSDDTYTPYTESTRKYKRRKPNLPIKDMINALQEAQPVAKAPRGRPPKRRDSNVSSTCSIDFSPESKYREIRDKNNEASKRSRMNRKLKELQMEQLALDLEERNKKLKVKADILEDMTKKLKEALMTAILKTNKP